MKRTQLVIILVAGLFVFFTLGGFGSHASNSKPENQGNGTLAPLSRPSIEPSDKGAAGTKEESASPKNEAPSSDTRRVGAEDEDSEDPDLGKFHGKIDHDTYLRMRDEFIALKRGIEPGRPFDPGARGRAIERMQGQEIQPMGKDSLLGSIANMLGLDLNAGATWTAIGPAPLPNGSAGAVSGRVTAVVVDPTNSNIVYLGAAQGGVWRSLDGGTSWAPIFDNAQSLAIGALALAPSNHTILYVGTGEFNGCGDCFFGAGLYRIDNADTSATLVGPINPTQTIGSLTYPIFNGRSISKILVHPTDPATIFVATARGIGGSGANALGQVPAIATRGLYRSSNANLAAGSVTFQKLVVTTDNSPDTPNTGNEDISDIVMDQGNPNNVLAAAVGPSGTSLLSRIYKTTNALSTATFSQVLSLPTNTRISLAINGTGSTATVYAATSETPANTTGCTTANSGAVRKSTDGGATWPATQLTGGGGFCGDQCFYDMPIAVDPTNANVVYIGGKTSSTCGRLVGKSTDGGNSFAADGSGLHVDEHALFFDGFGNIYTGNDGGIWKRSSSATAGSPWTDLNNAPLNTLQFESVAVHPFDQFLTIGGTQDNGTEYQQSSSGNWRGAEGGDGGYSLIDQSATDTTNVTMYHTFFNAGGTDGQIGFDRAVNTTCLPNKDFWPTRGVGFLPAPDNEQTSLSCDGTANYLHNGLSLSDNVLFYAPMALGPGTPNTLYFGTDRLYRSINRGDTMTVVSQAPINSTPCATSTVGPCPISTIAISPQGDSTRLAGLQNGQIWATSTGSSILVNLTAPATTFSFSANPNGSSNRFVGRVMIDPNNANVAYAALSYFAPAGQGVWKITNLGAAAGASPVAPVWTAAGNGIPSIPINALAIDPGNSNNIFAGTDIGVYYSTDGGANWAPFGTGLPRVAIFDMALQNANRILRVATHGRGVWEAAIGAASSAPATVRLTATDYPISENSGAGFVTVSAIREGDVTNAASVNYATSDTSSLNAACSQVTGKASERCDYATSLGTLSWAAGEAGTKSFNIPIINDALVEGTETFNVTLSNPIGVSLGATTTATVTILDNDTTASSSNPIDGVDFFITQQYIDFLGRMPDQVGFTNWQNTLAPCPNGGFGEFDNPNCDRIHVAAGFFQSDEFLNRGYWAFRFYMVSYNQRPTYAQFIPDMAQVGGPKSPAQEEASKVAFADAFVQRPEFTSRYPGLSGQPLADALWQTAGLPNSPITAGGMTNGQILRTVVETSAALNKFLTDGTVAIQYFGFLRRDPDTIGYQNNLATLRSDPNNLRHMIFIFIYSTEYRGRFGTP